MEVWLPYKEFPIYEVSSEGRVRNSKTGRVLKNIVNAYATGLKPPLRRTRVKVIETGEVFNSLQECARAIGGDRCQIRRCLDGKEKSCKGFHFELA